MYSKLLELSKDDLVQSLITSVFTSVIVTFGTTLISTMQGLIEMLNSGAVAFDIPAILRALFISIITGILTGFTAFLGSVLKKLSTNENGEIRVGSIKLK